MMWQPLSELAQDVQAGRVSALELASRSLQSITDNSSYNAVLKTNDRAESIAKDIDARVRNGEKIGPLAGVPYLAKDNYLTKGLETTAASRILKGFIPPFNATVIDRLEKAGAVLIGKTNLDAFAHGSSTENSDFGPTKNPIDPSRVPGGSSGGSAAAVKLGLVPFALGTDTGGSIRQPASFCGVVGYKPTYGLVSRYGVVAMASSTDVMGPLALSVEDAAYVLDTLAAEDPLDSTTIARQAEGYLNLPEILKGQRVGLVKEFLEEGVDEAVRRQVLKAVELFKSLGAKVETISLPSAREAISIYYVVVPAEVSSNLNRYDGVRYGPRSAAASMEAMYEATRTQGFNQENRRRIIIGTYVLSSGYYDAYYRKAQQARTVLINEFDKAFAQVDFLVGPTSPTTAFKLGEKSQDPLSMYMSDTLTVAPNLTGSPAISLPIGCDGGGLPVGLQIIAPKRKDRELLALASQFEKEYAKWTSS